VSLFRCWTSVSLALLWTLSTVTASGLFTSVHTLGVSTAANDLVANPWKVANPTTPDQNDRVFLEVMAFTGNVNGHFLAVAEPNTSDLAKSRVRLLRGHGFNGQANPLFLGASFQHRTFGRLVLNDSVATH
jgi:hypothetical protein